MVPMPSDIIHGDAELTNGEGKAAHQPAGLSTE